MDTGRMVRALLLCLFGLTWPVASRAANAPSGLLCDLLEHPEQTVITNPIPRFGWIYHPSRNNDAQSGFRIIVASSQSVAEAGTGDVWDSGWVHDARSLHVPYGGGPLSRPGRFFWRVQTEDGAGQASPFSVAQVFNLGDGTEAFIGRYPLRFVPAVPRLLTNTAPGRWFADFGQDAFGYATVQARGGLHSGTVQVRFGEMADGLSVNTRPPAGSLVRAVTTTFELGSDPCSYSLRPPAGVYPAGAVQPEGCGVVLPFRYLELVGFPGTLTAADVVQLRLQSEFNPNAARFSSSSSALDQVWTLCRNSMQWLTFDGIYVDGDRERKPYEADAYIQQLSSYAVDREFTLARHSLGYLLEHPTWPTEWKFHTLFMAWADYLQTGETNLLSKYYRRLQANSLTWAATDGGLMRGFPNFPQSTNSDVVDWPRADRDGFVISDERYLNWTNAVNNAFYYRGLQVMADIAGALGRTSDAANYASMAQRVYAAYNATFWDKTLGGYVDGVGTRHASAHANFFPLAFGLVPPGRQAAVVQYLHQRMAANGGMPCSVYAAQYLLEGLFAAGDVDTALGLMTTNGPRGWLNMLHLGSTLTTEAWSFEDKPNTDWNHAWGAAPGNVIARFVLGLRPLSAGFGHVLIAPQLGRTLNYAQGVVPTIRGPVSICASNAPEGLQVRLSLPGNVRATVRLPAGALSDPVAVVDGEALAGRLSQNGFEITNLGSGQHAVWLTTKAALRASAGQRAQGRTPSIEAGDRRPGNAFDAGGGAN